MHSGLLLIRIDRTFSKPNVKHGVYKSGFRGLDGKAIVETKMKGNKTKHEIYTLVRLRCMSKMPGTFMLQKMRPFENMDVLFCKTSRRGLSDPEPGSKDTSRSGARLKRFIPTRRPVEN